MTEPIAAMPGWADEGLDRIFARLPQAVQPACRAFAECLAASKAPAAPSDMLGTEFEPCHAAFRQALVGAAVQPSLLESVMGDLEALEAEIAAQS
ncbi:MAG: hypothetical protein RQ966_12310 [Acetobacteraceae bacterium]|nr:hypothetical protein [Acetobacteraceae bacterium]